MRLQTKSNPNVYNREEFDKNWDMIFKKQENKNAKKKDND